MMAVSASSPNVVHGACHIEWKRQSTFHSGEKTLNKHIFEDPLPIVELKPFVKKVWRREKSLPGFYNTYSTNVPATEESEQKPEQNSSSPSSQICLLSRSDNKVNSVTDRFVKSRAKHHPSVDSKHSKQPEHSYSILPGFITREERTKTTLSEIQQGESMGRVLNCRKQALNSRDVEKPRTIILNGDTIRHQNSKKKITYLNPFKNFGSLMASWQTLHEHKMRQFLPSGQHAYPYSAPEMRSRSMHLYDDFDRKGTLPSIKIGKERLQKRDTRSKSCNLPFDLPDTANAKKVGGIKNSFDVLSKIGTPTQIERHICLQLEINLTRYRQSRDYFPFDITPNELAKYYTPSNVNLTKGEKMLRQGLESNAPGSKRQTRKGVAASVIDATEERFSYKDTLSEPAIANRVFVTKGFECLKQRYSSFDDMRHKPNTPRSDIDNTSEIPDRRLRFADEYANPMDYFDDIATCDPEGIPMSGLGDRDDGSLSTTTSTPKDFAEMMQSNMSEVSDLKEEEESYHNTDGEDDERRIDNDETLTTKTFITSEHNKGLLQETDTVL